MKFLRAYDNQFNWDIHTNGEYYLVTILTDVAPGVVYDVGANVGDYVLMCKTVPNVTEVHAFEISPPTFAILSRNCGALKSVYLNPVGLAAISGTVPIHHSSEASTTSGIYLPNDGIPRNVVEAEVLTGDEYTRKTGIKTITLLKIDVEGADLDVLRGFSSTFEQGRVAAVQFEHGEINIEARVFLRDIVEFLLSFGFIIFKLFPNTLEPIGKYNYSLEDFRGRNYVALRPDIARAVGLYQ